jgi:hypothetical protein
MTLLIDDQRNLTADIIARTYEAGERILRDFPITYLKLDHDLGTDGKTGYDIVLLLEEWHNEDLPYLLKKDLPETVELVTDNPVGMHKMAMALEKIYPHSVGRRFFSMKRFT